MTIGEIDKAWIESLDTPALLIDRAVLERNVGRVAAQLSKRRVALRPHFKTHKTIEIAQLQQEYGAVGQSCASLGEAHVLAAAGFSDIFVALPVWPGGLKRRALQQLHEDVDLKVGVDSLEGAIALADAVRGSTKALKVLVEIDSGGRRTGVRPEDAGAVSVAAANVGLDVEGVFTHGGHSYGLGDAVQRAAHDEVEGLAVAVESLRRHGMEARVVSAGSTPTALLSAEGLVTEERPGTYVFGDRQQVVIGSCDPADIALVVASTVISRAVEDQVVLDAGTKCLGRELQPWMKGFGQVQAWPRLSLERLYDHHGVAMVPPGGERPTVGDVLAVIPNHVCPVVNLARELVIVEGGQIVDRWSVAARAVV